MEKEQVKEILGMWRKTNRMLFVAGIVAGWMFLGLSFIRPHVDILLYFIYFPGILYAIYFAYYVNKQSKRLMKIKDGLG